VRQQFGQKSIRCATPQNSALRFAMESRSRSMSTAMRRFPHLAKPIVPPPPRQESAEG
jgi:hypothetical protein